MIKFADENMLGDLKGLFKECFDLDFYSPYGVFYITNIFKNYKPLIYFIDGKIVSMLTLIPLNLVSDNRAFYGFYIYGVGTLKEYRNKNIATKMLNWVEEYSRELNKDFNILIPANNNEFLHDFYSKRGFKTEVKQRIILLTKNEVLNSINDGDHVFNFKLDMENSLLKELRNKNYKCYSHFIEWNENELDIVKKEYSLPEGKHYILNFNRDQYAIIDLRDEKRLTIREYYILNNNMGSFFRTLLAHFPTYEFFEFTLPDSDYYSSSFSKNFITLDTAMVKFFEDKLFDCTKPFYFNFGLDT